MSWKFSSYPHTSKVMHWIMMSKSVKFYFTQFFIFPASSTLYLISASIHEYVIISSKKILIFIFIASIMCIIYALFLMYIEFNILYKYMFMNFLMSNFVWILLQIFEKCKRQCTTVSQHAYKFKKYELGKFVWK